MKIVLKYLIILQIKILLKNNQTDLAIKWKHSNLKENITHQIQLMLKVNKNLKIYINSIKEAHFKTLNFQIMD